MLHAIIDVGSNTIRLSIFDIGTQASKPVQIYNKKAMAGLAGYIDGDGSLSERGIKRAIDCIQSHQRKIVHFHVDTVSAFATAVLRNAANSTDAVRQIQEATGLDLQVLSGDDEARLGFFGAMHGLEASEGALFDIGGASTEIVVFEQRKPVFSTSLSFGSLSLFLSNVDGVVADLAEQACIRATVEDALEKLDGIRNYSFETVFGIGGSIRAAGKLSDALFHDGHKMLDIQLADMEAMLTRFGKPGREGLREILSVVPDRIHTVVPGMVCAHAVARKFNSSHIVVSPYGVREGYLFTHVIGEC